MEETSLGFMSELRISVRPVAIILMVIGLFFIFAVNPLATSGEQLRELCQWIIIEMVLGFALWAEIRKPLVSRWCIILVLISMIFIGSTLWNAPVIFTLSVIPVSLSAALIGVPAAIFTSIGETVLLVASLILFPSGGIGPVITTSLVSIWITLVMMREIYSSIHNVTRWAWDYYHHAYSVLKEAQDSRAELAQALADLVHANRQLALFNKRVSDYRLIAEQALQAKSDFVAKVSHEFRTPLNIIIGLVELMVETPEIYEVMPSPDMHNDLEVIYRNSEHLSNMIDDVLDLTRTEAGYLTLHRERLDLHTIVESAMIAVRPLIENKKLNLTILVPDNLPEVYCDGIRIEQVILNLVSNAARHTDQGGISIQVVEKDPHILVSVEDTGSGISPDDVDRIFEPFLQGRGQIERDKEGSGLGLSISKQIVERHGGQMWVKSQLGVGTTFTFDLPISPPLIPVGKPGNQIVEELIWNEPRSRVLFPDSHYKPRLVIYDEMGELRNMLSHFSDEVEFVNARNQDQVIEALQDSPANALLLNIASYNDVFQSIEVAKQRAPGTPIIVCSVPPKIDFADAYGILGYLTKPVTRPDLISAVQAVGKPINRVLVVDDDPAVQDIFTRMLHVYDSTLEVMTASSGEQAIYELHRFLPDLMLLDVVMPDMDGWQLLKVISQDENIGKVPTLVVSAQDPTSKPAASAFILAAMDKELSISKLLNCSLKISEFLLKPEVTLDLVPEETV